MFFFVKNSKRQRVRNVQKTTTTKKLLLRLYFWCSGISGVFECKNWSLFCPFTQICRIENLSRLSELRALNLAGNNIVKVENLHNLDSLTELNLRHNRISEVVRGRLHFTSFDLV